MIWGRRGVSYLSYIHSEILASGYTTKCRLGVIFFTWYIVKLGCYVSNYIIHIVSKMISRTWLFCDVTITS